MPKPDSIKKVADSKHAFIGLFGRSGIGKTRLVGTTADVVTHRGDNARTLILRPPTDHTDGMLPPHKQKVDEWVVKDHQEFADDVLTYLRHEGGKDYDWVWLDSISLFTDHGLDDIWADIIAAKPHRAKYGLDKGEYFTNMERISRVVRAIVTLDQFNFGWVAHQMQVPDEHDNEIMVPQIQVKNMWNKFSGYMNMIAYYQIAEMNRGGSKKDTRVLRFAGTSDYYAKDQFDAFLPNNRLVDPTMPKVVEAIEKARGAKLGVSAAATAKKGTTKSSSTPARTRTGTKKIIKR